MFENVINQCDALIQTYKGKKTEIEQAVSKAISDLRESDAQFRSSFSGIFGVYKGRVVVGGRADTYYPVVFNAPSDSTKIGSGEESTFNMVHTLELTRYYYQSPKPDAGNPEVPYNGSHWLSMQFKVEFTGHGWDGGPNHAAIVNHMLNYRRGVGAIRTLNHNAKDLVIWLRGGGTSYNWSSSYPHRPKIFCEDGNDALVDEQDYYSKPEFGRLEHRVAPVTDVELARLEKFIASANQENFPNWNLSSNDQFLYRHRNPHMYGRPQKYIGNSDGFLPLADSSPRDAIVKFGLLHRVRIGAQADSPLESSIGDSGFNDYRWGIWLRSRFCRWYRQALFTDIADVKKNPNFKFENTKYTRMTETNPNGDLGIT